MSFAERFVRFPELFPARNAGERWGDGTLTIALPGGPYVFTGLSPSQLTAMEERYAGCVADEAAAAPAVETALFRVEREEFLPVDTRGWEYELDLDPAPGLLRLAGMSLMARIERGRGAGTAVWTPETEGGHFIGVVENVFRPLVAYRVLERGGIMVHSSGVVVEGKGFLFVGRSGAGKSTLASLALESGRAILSDDLNVILPSGGGWVVEQLPFAGEYPGLGARGSFPLRAIQRLEKGPEHEVSRMSAARGFAALFECTPYVNVDPNVAEPLEGVVARIVDDLAPGCLTFRPDPGVWPIIEAR